MASESSRKLSMVKHPLSPDLHEVDKYCHTKTVSHYLIGQIIGKGAFATVNEGLHTLTSEKVAVKIICKSLCNKDNYIKKHLRREGKILQQLRHPNIVQLLEIMETENSYYLVLELCSYNLMTRILRSVRLTEPETRMYLRQLVLAIDYLHKLSIMHRDLKVENILLTKDDVLKVADFGVSIQLSVQNSLTPNQAEDIVSYQRHLCKTQCGSPAYAAPEVLSRSLYSYSVDVWSIGVNMFAMLTGRLPFTVKPFNIQALKDKMINGDMNKLPDNISSDCKNLLMHFLEPEPLKRISLRDAMQHVWFNIENTSRWQHNTNTYDVNSALIRYMDENLGINKTETIKSVMQNLTNSSHATYHLLMRKAQRYCNLEQISLSKWLYSNCSRTETYQDNNYNKSLQKLNPFNEITNSKSKETVAESVDNTKQSSKMCEETEYKSNNCQANGQVTVKASTANPTILRKRLSIGVSSAKSVLELNKYGNNSRVLPHINEINIPYFTQINPSISQKSSLVNSSRAYTTMQTYCNRKLSIADDMGHLPKPKFQSSFRRKNDDKFQFPLEINRPRRFSMGSRNNLK